MRMIDADALANEIAAFHPMDVGGSAMQTAVMAKVAAAPTVEPDFWTSVKDRLPEIGKEVLVLIPVKDVLVPDMGGLMGNDDWWSTTTYNGMEKPVFWAEIPRGPAGWKWYADEEAKNELPPKPSEEKE